MDSTVFTVIVGTDDPRTFVIHDTLLADESDRLAVSVQGRFSEGTERKIHLEEEDPELFGYFVKYLYNEHWGEGGVSTDTEYVILARLYTLGDRLQARRFQKTVFQKLLRTWPASPQVDEMLQGIPLHHICELLEIVLTELPDEGRKDPLREQVLWAAAETYRRHPLGTVPYFRRLQLEHPDLLQLVSSKRPEPTREGDPSLRPRFEQESTFRVPAVQRDFSGDFAWGEQGVARRNSRRQETGQLS